jgi:hypothetical protein
MNTKYLNLEKKEIVETLYLYIDIDEILKGSLHDVANNILAIENRLKNECEMVVRNPDKYIRFNIDIHNGYYDSNSPELKLYGVRMETDEEFEKRINEAKKAKIAKENSEKKRKENEEKNELNTYLRLKKKFSDKK